MSCFQSLRFSRGYFKFEIYGEDAQQRGDHEMKKFDARSRVQEADNKYRPVKTFATAVMYYHKFRLVHSDGEYAYTVSQVLRLLLLVGS